MVKLWMMLKTCEFINMRAGCTFRLQGHLIVYQVMWKLCKLYLTMAGLYKFDDCLNICRFTQYKGRSLIKDKLLEDNVSRLVYVCEPSADRVLHPRGSALYCVSKEKSDYSTEHRPAREVIQTPLWWPTYLFMRWTNQKFVSLQWKCFMPISSYKKREGQSMTIWLRPKQYISQGKCLGSFEKGGVIFYKSHMDIWYILHNEFSIWV